jgi:hypothetical protein
VPHESFGTASVLTGGLAAVSRRLCVDHVLRGLTIAVPPGALAFAMLARGGWTTSAAGGLVLTSLIGTLTIWLARRCPLWSAAAAARAIELAVPESRNVVVTAEELLRHPDRARPWILTRVVDRAAEITRHASRAEAVPLGRRGLLASAAVAFAIAVVGGFSERAVRVAREAMSYAVNRGAPAGEDSLSIAATITPPAYTGEPARTIDNPERIDALQGSQLRLVLKSQTPWRARFGAERIEASASPEGTVVELGLSKSGYLAFESQDAVSGGPRLLPVAVVPDRPPMIRVETPGKDLLVPDSKPVVGLSAFASDDFGLQSLELRYTRASGSGEQFEFHEGSIPLSIAQDNTRAWTARADIALAQLGLAPGDAIIYRVIGHDRRPGDAGLASSDTFYIEVAGPGQVALAGFELPPDRERHALSQQMIVLKLERLLARERTLDRATLEGEVANIAAEQRAVRANFVFLMGGHIEDEEEEAQQSHEIQEGRLENTARREIVTAIQQMVKVEQGLAIVSTTAALPPARAAVEALQRAFGRNRYFLRTLPVRSRVDPLRRLTGETSSAADWQRELPPAVPDSRTRAARALLARLLRLTHSINADSAEASALTVLAEEALAVDPAAGEWQAISTSLLQLRDGLRENPTERSMRLNRAVSLISAVLQRDVIVTRPLDRENAALRSVWAREHRQ